MVKTELHDIIHLWMHNETNRGIFSNRMFRTIEPLNVRERDNVKTMEPQTCNEDNFARDHDYRCVTIRDWEFVSKDIEVPIVRGRAVSHTNTIDCIITLNLICTAFFRMTHGAEKQFKYRRDDVKFPVKLLCEYKPKLESISSLIGQIHIYERRLYESNLYTQPTIIPVLVTLDDNEDYDQLIHDEGIRVFRLKYNSNKRRAELPEPITDAALTEFQPQTQTQLTPTG